MSQVDQWLTLDPLDTLFFKGSEPMIAGEGHEVSSLFPPMPETCVGALCTAILRQRGLRPRDYAGPGGPAAAVRERFPLLGEPGSPGFRVVGPLLCWEKPSTPPAWFYPAPAHWFADLEGAKTEEPKEITVAIADEAPELYSVLGLCGSIPCPAWVLHPASESLKSLAGYWVNDKAIQNVRQGSLELSFITDLCQADPDQPLLVPLKALFAPEIRTGIALDYGLRRVRQGHLYTATQVRLTTGVSLIIGLSPGLAPHYLDAEGLLHLGGEQRRVRYAFLPAGHPLAPGDSPWLMSLMPFPWEFLGPYGWQDCLRVSGPLIRVAGWDMKEKFHKPSRAFFPAGTVIKGKPGGEVPFGFIRL
jgi:CRISPR-associated protein Cmr3